MHNRWSRRIALGIVSALTASFAFVGFVEGPAGASTITQSSPTTGAATATTSAGFTSALVTAGNAGAVTYVENQTGSFASVIVSSSGVVTTSGPLGAGTYFVTGSDSDTSSDTGVWTFTLTVAIAQSSPTTGTATTTGSSAFTSALVTTGNSGPVTYAENTSTHSTQVLVSSTGVVTTSGPLAAGTYTVTGTDSDTASNGGMWTFTLTVTLPQSSPTTGTATTATSAAFTSALVVTGNSGTVTYAENTSAHSTQVLVSSTGVVTTSGPLAVGTYTVTGSDSDTARTRVPGLLRSR